MKIIRAKTPAGYSSTQWAIVDTDKPGRELFTDDGVGYEVLTVDTGRTIGPNSSLAVILTRDELVALLWADPVLQNVLASANITPRWFFEQLDRQKARA